MFSLLQNNVWSGIRVHSGLGHDTETKCGPGAGRGSGATDHMAAGGASIQSPVMNIVSCSPTCRTSTENQSSLR